MRKLAGSLVDRKGDEFESWRSTYRLLQFHSPQMGMQSPVFDKGIPNEGKVLYRDANPR